MFLSALRRLYAPEYMVKGSLRAGNLPSARNAYSTAFRIAGPAMAESFFIALTSMVDNVMVSGVGTQAVAAVGIVTQPRLIVLALVMSLNIAVTAITARRKGEENRQGACDCLKQSLVLSLLLSTAVSLLAFIFCQEFLRFAGAQIDTIGPAENYFRILLLGIPANCVSLTISAAQRGIGRTRVSMIVNITSNIINICLNYLLIGGNLGFPRLEVRGAAIATVISWAIGLVIALASVIKKDRFLCILSRAGWAFDRGVLSVIGKVGAGSFLEQFCLRIGFLMFAKILAELGTVAYATHFIAMNLLSLSFCFGDGLGVSASSLVGQNLGRKRPDLSLMYGNICQRISLLCSAFLFFLFVFGGRLLFSLFTSEPEIMATGAILTRMAGFIIFGQSSQLVFMGCLRGAGDTRYVAIISMITITIIRPILSYILAYPLGLGLIGGWTALFLDQYVRLFLTYRRFSSGKWISIRL